MELTNSLRAIVVVVAAAALAGAALAKGPDLTGTWIPDVSASTRSKELKHETEPGAPPAPPPPPQGMQEQLPAMRISHKEPRVTVTFLDDGGAAISSTELTTNGKENLNKRADGSLLHKSRTSWKGRVLQTAWKLEQGGRVLISGTESRELVSPSTLVVTTTTEDSKSRSQTVILYRRKEG